MGPGPFDLYPRVTTGEYFEVSYLVRVSCRARVSLAHPHVIRRGFDILRAAAVPERRLL